MTLNRIYEEMLAAAACFGKGECDMVYGEGSERSGLMLVGEAPGAEETKLLRPFVGQAGRNLDEFLAVLGQSRSEIYITNVVKFRPYKVSPKGRLSNRPPRTEEIKLMAPLLIREIEAVAPKVVVTLGNVPLKCVLGDKAAVIGERHAAPAQATANSHAFTVFPLYHPASIIYNRALKDVYIEDLQKLKEHLRGIAEED